MGYLKIHCEHCGGGWVVYAHQVNDEQANCCPHCFAEIDRQTWGRQIIPAFAALEDANRELLKDHAGYHVSRFWVEYGAVVFR